MKKFLGIALGLAVSMAMVMPASAFVVVFGDIDKWKDIDVNEYIFIDKTVLIDVDVVALPVGAAEATALVNQDNVANTVSGFNPELADQAIDFEGPPEEVFDNYAYSNFRQATILDSINENLGITGVNQDAGNFNNQGNNFAVAISDATSIYANSESHATQVNALNSVYVNELFENLTDDPTCEFGNCTLLPPQKTDLLTNSMNYNVGITSANQSVGNMNNQLNSVAVAAGLQDATTGANNVVVAMAEADLGQFNVYNTVVEINTNKSDTIENSLNSNVGITSFNQSAGNMNNQASIVSVSVTLPR